MRRVPSELHNYLRLVWEGRAARSDSDVNCFYERVMRPLFEPPNVVFRYQPCVVVLAVSFYALGWGVTVLWSAVVLFLTAFNRVHLVLLSRKRRQHILDELYFHTMYHLSVLWSIRWELKHRSSRTTHPTFCLVVCHLQRALRRDHPIYRKKRQFLDCLNQDILEVIANLEDFRLGILDESILLDSSMMYELFQIVYCFNKGFNEYSWLRCLLFAYDADLQSGALTVYTSQQLIELLDGTDEQWPEFKHVRDSLSLKCMAASQALAPIF